MDEGQRTEEAMEDLLVQVISRIQRLQIVLGESAENKWIVEQLDKALTVQLPDGRETYLGVRTSEPWPYRED